MTTILDFLYYLEQHNHALLMTMIEFITSNNINYDDTLIINENMSTILQETIMIYTNSIEQNICTSSQLNQHSIENTTKSINDNSDYSDDDDKSCRIVFQNKKKHKHPRAQKEDSITETDMLIILGKSEFKKIKSAIIVKVGGFKYRKATGSTFFNKVKPCSKKTITAHNKDRNADGTFI